MNDHLTYESGGYRKLKTFILGSVWPEEHFLHTDFIARKVGSNKAFHAFVDNALSRFPQMQKSEIVANAALLLINIEKYLLSRQIVRLSDDFLKQGGFRERMTHFRRKTLEK